MQEEFQLVGDSFQINVLILTSVLEGCEVATQLNEQNLVTSTLSCQFSTCLHGIFEGASEKEKSRRMLESLFSQQREGILQCCFPPPVLVEVVVEKLCHFDILLRPVVNGI